MKNLSCCPDIIPAAPGCDAGVITKEGTYLYRAGEGYTFEPHVRRDTFFKADFLRHIIADRMTSGFYEDVPGRFYEDLDTLKEGFGELTEAEVKWLADIGYQVKALPVEEEVREVKPVAHWRDRDWHWDR
jgi:hypothetical protein